MKNNTKIIILIVTIILSACQLFSGETEYKWTELMNESIGISSIKTMSNNKGEYSIFAGTSDENSSLLYNKIKNNEIMHPEWHTILDNSATVKSIILSVLHKQEDSILQNIIVGTLGSTGKVKCLEKNEKSSKSPEWEDILYEADYSITNMAIQTNSQNISQGVFVALMGHGGGGKLKFIPLTKEGFVDTSKEIKTLYSNQASCVYSVELIYDSKSNPSGILIGLVEFASSGKLLYHEINKDGFFDDTIPWQNWASENIAGVMSIAIIDKSKNTSFSVMIGTSNGKLLYRELLENGKVSEKSQWEVLYSSEKGTISSIKQLKENDNTVSGIIISLDLSMNKGYIEYLNLNENISNIRNEDWKNIYSSDLGGITCLETIENSSGATHGIFAGLESLNSTIGNLIYSQIPIDLN